MDGNFISMNLGSINDMTNFQSNQFQALKKYFNSSNCPIPRQIFHKSPTTSTNIIECIIKPKIEQSLIHINQLQILISEMLTLCTQSKSESSQNREQPPQKSIPWKKSYPSQKDKDNYSSQGFDSFDLANKFAVAHTPMIKVEEPFHSKNNLEVPGPYSPIIKVEDEFDNKNY